MINKISTQILLVFSLFLILNQSVFPQNSILTIKSEAIKQMSQARYGEAIDLLNRFISAKPQVAEGYNLRGICYERRAQYEYAVYDFRSARKLEPKNNEIADNLSRTTEIWYALLYNKIEGHKREIAVYPDKPVNYLEIGKSYKNLGEWKTAEEWYDKYLIKEEASPDEIIRYTEILSKNNHISKGEPILKRYVEKYPDDHRLWSRYGYYTLWLGKKRIAIEAFKHALELRPYFKEAMDGYEQAMGRGYIYTVNDTSIRYGKTGFTSAKGKKEYAIDKYFRILKNNPDDTATRKLLIKELMKVNRYEEAKNELQVLAATYGGTDDYKTLAAEFEKKRNEFYSSRINELKKKFVSDPSDKKTAYNLAESYSLTGKFEEAANVYRDYLLKNPNDIEARFRLAQNLSWDRNFEDAASELDIILQAGQDSVKYRLLRAQLAVWLNEDLDKAENLLKEILEKDQQNLQALITLSTLNFQKRNYSEAEKFADLAIKIDSSNQGVTRLFYMLDLQKRRDKESVLFSLLEDAREAAFKKNCEKSIELYKDYISKAGSSRSVMNEFANAFVCAGDYKSAIKIYDDLLHSEYEYELDKQRAKVYFWSGDSLNAMKEFQRISSKNPQDAEAKLYLGDAYVQMKRFDDAEKVYKGLLAEAPNSYIIQQRISWLPQSGAGGIDAVPTYILLAPEGIFFSDNLGFQYDLQGLRAEVGITDFLALGASAFRGGLASDTSRLNLYTYKGHLFFRFGKYISLNGGYGQTRFPNNNWREIFDASLKAEEKNKWMASASFISNDAAQVLYSPNLVDLRLKANQLLLSGNFLQLRSLILSGEYSYFDISDGNEGNNFKFRLGNRFTDHFSAGYEYYYSNFKDSLNLYFSPQNYELHSIWGDLYLIKEKEAELVLGGKLGYIFENDFFVREIFGRGRVNVLENLILQGEVTAGSSLRENVGYNSLSFYAALFWGL